MDRDKMDVVQAESRPPHKPTSHHPRAVTERSPQHPPMKYSLGISGVDESTQAVSMLRQAPTRPQITPPNVSSDFASAQSASPQMSPSQSGHQWEPKSISKLRYPVASTTMQQNHPFAQLSRGNDNTNSAQWSGGSYKRSRADSNPSHPPAGLKKRKKDGMAASDIISNNEKYDIWACGKVLETGMAVELTDFPKRKDLSYTVKPTDNPYPHLDKTYLDYMLKEAEIGGEWDDEELTPVLPMLAFFWWQIMTSAKGQEPEASQRVGLDNMIQFGLCDPSTLIQLRRETTLDLPSEKPRSGRNCIADCTVLGLLRTVDCLDPQGLAYYRQHLQTIKSYSDRGVLYTLLLAIEHKRKEDMHVLRQLTLDMYNSHRQRSQLGLSPQRIYGVKCLNNTVSLHPSWVVPPPGSVPVSIDQPQISVGDKTHKFDITNVADFLALYRLVRYHLRPYLERIRVDDQVRLENNKIPSPDRTLPPPAPGPSDEDSESSNGSNDDGPGHASKESSSAPRSNPFGPSSGSYPASVDVLALCDSPITTRATLHNLIMDRAQIILEEGFTPHSLRELAGIWSEMRVAWVKYCDAHGIDTQWDIFNQCLQEACSDARDDIEEFRTRLKEQEDIKAHHERPLGTLEIDRLAELQSAWCAFDPKSDSFRKDMIKKYRKSLAKCSSKNPLIHPMRDTPPHPTHQHVGPSVPVDENSQEPPEVPLPNNKLLLDMDVGAEMELPDAVVVVENFESNGGPDEHAPQAAWGAVP